MHVASAETRPTLDRRTPDGTTGAIAKLAPELTGRNPPWDIGSLKELVRLYRENGFEIIGLEGDQFDMTRIKHGLPGRDEDIERYKTMLSNMGEVGIPLICLNFMARGGWHRTRTAAPTRGGALVSSFSLAEAEAQRSKDVRSISADQVWDNFAYFIKAVAPAAEKARVRMGLHPDDPPVPTLHGVAQVLTSADAMAKAIEIADSPAVGLTFCQGTYRTMGEDVAASVRHFGSAGKIFFIHVRDVKGTRENFTETFPEEGDTDMAAVFEAYREIGFDGPIRPDHAPAMDGDPKHDGPVVGTNVGYEANGMIYTVGFIKGLRGPTASLFHRT